MDNLIADAGMNHREVSTKIGNSANWMNDAFNNNEDIRISSLMKILSIMPGISDKTFNELFDNKMLKITAMMNSLSEESSEYMKKFILSEKQLFMDVIGDWAVMIGKKKINEEEKNTAEQVRKIISI